MKEKLSPIKEKKESPEEKIIIENNKYIPNLNPDDNVQFDICDGACIVGISKIENTYSVGHFPPGRIVDEFSGMASNSEGKELAIYSGSAQGTVADLFNQGKKLNKERIKKFFKSRDLPYRGK